MSRSVRLQQSIKTFERDRLESLGDTFAVEANGDAEADRDVASDEKVVFLRRQEITGRILFSKVIYKEASYDVPSLIWPTGLDEVVSDWLRHLAIKLDRTKGTTEDCAKAVRAFSQLREELGIAWNEADDETLRLWKTRMLERGNDPKYINKYIGYVHSFYRWAEETGRLTNRVEIIDRRFLPLELRTYKFPISSRHIPMTKRSGRIVSEWRSTVFVSGGRSSEGKRDTPTDEQFENLLDVAIDDERNGTRNSLLLSWANDTGGRVHEILQVKLSDLPKTDADFRRLQQMDFWPIAIKRKGPKHRRGTLRPSYDLIMRTIAYARTERAQLEERLRGKIRGRCESVFLSEKGGALSEDSATRICRGIFRTAGVKNANIHRLRAKFAQTMVEAAIQALEESGVAVSGTSNWHETALTMAMEMMGHSSIRSLRPYLTRVLKRRVDLSQAAQRHKSESAQSERKLLERQQMKALEGNATLARIGALLRAGKTEEAHKELIAFSSQLTAV